MWLIKLIVTITDSEVVEKFPALRPTITEKLTNTLSTIRSAKVFRGVLWIIGEYVEGLADIEGALEELRKSIGEIPILAAEVREVEGSTHIKQDGEESTEHASGVGKTRILADGTYATETVYSMAPSRSEATKTTKPPLRGK